MSTISNNDKTYNDDNNKDNNNNYYYNINKCNESLYSKCNTTSSKNMVIIPNYIFN